jgi:hypothetical protein
MRSLSKTVLVFAAAGAAIITTFTPAVAATGGDTINGGCMFDVDAAPTVDGNGIGNPTHFEGVVSDSSVTQDAAGLPTGATVTCKLQANSVDIPGTTFSYTGVGVQAGADHVAFDVTPDESVFLCQRVVYADGTDTGWNPCGPSPCTCPPPQLPLMDQINALLTAINDATIAYVDPQVCPVLAANAGSYGPVTIMPDGDVYLVDPLNLGLSPAYDCPPYGNF